MKKFMKKTSVSIFILMLLVIVSCSNTIMKESADISEADGELALPEQEINKKIALGYWSILWSELGTTYTSIDEQLQYIHSLDYDGVELCAIDPFTTIGVPGPICIEKGDKEAREELIALLQKHSLEVPEYLVLQNDNLISVIEWLDFMNDSDLGAFTSIINIMPPTDEEILNAEITYEDYVIYRKNFVEKMQAAADRAAESGYSIALETEPGEGFCSPSEIVGIAEEIDRENLFIQLDLGHTYSILNYENKGKETVDLGVQYNEEFNINVPDLRDASIQEYFATCNKYVGVKGVQLWDNGLTAETAAENSGSGFHYALGEGKIDFKEYLTALQNDTQLDSEWLITEFFGSEHHIEAVENAVDTLKQYCREYDVFVK